MASRLCVFLIAFFFGSLTSVEIRPELIVWNVGQGQWVTLVDEAGCWHFDIGGEFAPWTSLMNECRARKNYVSLSHWDWDHVGLVSRASRFLPQMCLLLGPPGEIGKSARKMRLLENLSSCGGRSSVRAADFASWVGGLSSTSNASSRVVMWRRILIPGDSPIDQEKKWIKVFANLEKVRFLILGHHGSQTSNGKDLLNRLQGVKLAIASSRSNRYGHPHQKVRNALRDRGIPLLTTEDWGTIRIPL